MASDNIQDLLVLQDRNATVQQLELEINRLPKEVKKLKDKIEKEKAEAASAQKDVTDLELKRKELELEVESAQEQIGKYKTQQLQVKKNDEYRALTHEIELMEEKISGLETQALEIMEASDSANTKLKEVEAEVAKKVKYQEGLIVECNEKLKNLKSNLGASKAAYKEQIEKMDPKEVSLFTLLVDQIKRTPYLVELSDQNCGGCHMRVSNDVLKKAKMGELARCDQCARVVYFDS